MADLFPGSRLQTPTYREQPSHLRFKRRGVPIAIISYLILFSSFFGAAGGNGVMDILSSEFRPFRQFAGSATRHLQPHQAVEPTVPELGMLILGAAVYTTQDLQRGRSLTMPSVIYTGGQL